MDNVIHHGFGRPPFVAVVVFDAESGMWVVTCDALHVVTEGNTYEAAISRFWDIAPEIAADNGTPFDASSQVEFRHAFPVPTTVESRHTANGILKQAGIVDRF